MTLFEVAQIYTDLVKAEREIPEIEHCAKDQLNALRTKYHELLMEIMRRGGIDFVDRFDASRQAFEIVAGDVIECPLAGETFIAEDDKSEDE
jgi:hypothetical protein